MRTAVLDPDIEKSGTHPTWVWSIVLSFLVLLLYASILKHLAEQWWTDPDYGHGFFIPLFSGYVLWRERKKWMCIESSPNNWGLLVMVGAVTLLLFGSLGAELFTSRVSLLLLLAGIILFLAGTEFLHAVSFPLAFLLLMIPIPEIIYNQITFPLQLLASRLATYCVELVGIPVLRDGNILMLSNYSLEVVEACSGIRSLMTLISLAIVYGYFVERRRWLRYLLVAMMVPIAIISNAIRILGAAAMAHRYGPPAAEGFLHVFSGWVIFVAALMLMFLSHRVVTLFGNKEQSGV